MGEEKLYAVKNDEGKYWDFEDQDGFWELNIVDVATVAGEEGAKCVAHDHGGHVVTFVEEPEKVVLTKEQAKIVEGARDATYPASYISNYTNSHDCEENLLINAYVNGYTVAKEKKYNVKVPHVSLYYWKMPEGGLGIDDLNATISYGDDTSDFEFTESDIEHYNLQDCEKEEVTDDDD